MNANIQNNYMNNISIINNGLINNQNVINSIISICSNFIQNADAHISISKQLKAQLKGEWFVAIKNDNDDYEFKFSEAETNNFTILEFFQKKIYIYQYIS